MTLPQPIEIKELQRQLDRASQTNAELALVVEMARELSQSVELKDIGAVATRTALSLTGASLSSLWIRDVDGKIQVLSSASGTATADVPHLASREGLLARGFASQKPVFDKVGATGDQLGAVLPLVFDNNLLAVLELVGLPFPENVEEQVQTLQHALPVVVLSLKNALVTGQLQEALKEIGQKNELLERQNGELQTQNEEIQGQDEEIRAQNEELEEHQRQLEAKNLEVEEANQELQRLIAVEQEQEERLRAIIDSTADGLMVVDGNRKIIVVNPALEAMIGYSAEDLVGRDCNYLLGARREDGEFLCDTTCPFLHPEGAGPHSVDATVTTRDGRTVWVNVAYGPIYDKNGRPTAIVHAIRDISARKELEQLKDEFLSMTAHDLKSPLTAVKGYAQLLYSRAEREGNRANELSALKAIDTQAGHMLDLINRLLDLTRLQMGRLELQPRLTDFRVVSERVIEQAQVTTDRHQLLLQVEGQDFQGIWDSTYVEQVLRNLVDNAIKYSPQGGSVEVELRLVDREVFVSVSDQGTGIPKADQSRVFERYFRTESARRGARGLGLGLYISRGLIEAHGGRIWLESQVGQGSTFHFTLPLRSHA